MHPEDARNITGKVLALIGADDPMVHADERRAFEEEMRAGGVDWELNVYGGAVHSFTNTLASPDTFPGIGYHEATDRRSWQAMVDLFHEVFGRLTYVSDAPSGADYARCPCLSPCR